ncbi:hypothetical protein Y032_0015g2528 [Ancylostoma ceylanicum]|uniref:Uncharacterized protein n=1 Tax=Ancylostoma ceylanicum TaxID=53326 RepID=A0A016V6C6_9BILA|nr:hypothetical protein Y032_0015g2528 [Ancylostoma ceylanicum]
MGSGDPQAICGGLRISCFLPQSVSFPEVTLVFNAHFEKFVTVMICFSLFRSSYLFFDHIIPCFTQNCQIFTYGMKFSYFGSLHLTISFLSFHG